MSESNIPPVIVSEVAAHMGRLGGKQTAKRGSAYFRKLQAKRKNRRGRNSKQPQGLQNSSRKGLTTASD